MNNYEKIKNMSIEEMAGISSIEFNTQSEDKHITRHWCVGIDGEIYKSRKEMIQGVVAWLQQEAE